jgi:UDP-2-acetamido-3-amino-2,3-dideoxy-glucuronate N-acetyltransferase
MSALIHPTAIVETDRLGEGCRVHEHASLGEGVTLDADVEVGAGARLLGKVRVGPNVTVGANAVVGRAGAEKEIRVGRGVRVGANVTVAPGAAIGRGAVVEAGSVVETDVPAFAVVRGSPARIVGYVDTLPELTEPEVLDLSALDKPTPTGVPGVVLHPLMHARDLRGSLAAAEFAGLPFIPQRVFAVYDVPSESVRGAHAHRACGQLLVCMSGEVSSVADDGSSRQEFRLASPRVALYIPPMVWSMQYRYTSDACLMVLAELPYDPDDYVRDYEEFLEVVAVGSEAG